MMWQLIKGTLLVLLLLMTSCLLFTLFLVLKYLFKLWTKEKPIAKYDDEGNFRYWACPECGGAVELGSSICDWCGKHLKSGDE